MILSPLHIGDVYTKGDKSDTSDPTKWMSTTRKQLSIIIIKNRLQKQHYDESITKMVLPKNGYKIVIMKSC